VYGVGLTDLQINQLVDSPSLTVVGTVINSSKSCSVTDHDQTTDHSQFFKRTSCQYLEKFVRLHRC